MLDADDHVTDAVTVDDLEAYYEGRDCVLGDPSKDHFVCDWCEKDVPYPTNERLGLYLTNDVINDDHPSWRLMTVPVGSPPLVPIAVYCEECTTRRLLLPCEGYAEARLTFNIGEDKTSRDVEVTDVSPSEDGIPWNPAELYEQVTGVPFDKNVLLSALLTQGNELWGPEDVVRICQSIGAEVDIREVIRADGSLSPGALSQAQEAYTEFSREYQRNGCSRKWFQEHLRQDR